MGHQCAWCKRNLGPLPLVGAISHGICDGCYIIVTQQVADKRRPGRELRTQRRSNASC
jgi:hypothetical protein